MKGYNPTFKTSVTRLAFAFGQAWTVILMELSVDFLEINQPDYSLLKHLPKGASQYF